jgi:hypothetical protein
VPIYLEISRLNKTAIIVARGKITAGEIYSVARQLADAQARKFAKIIEVAAASTDLPQEQVARLAALLGGLTHEERGPVSFVVDPNRTNFPQAFAQQTEGQGPIHLFKSLR